MIRVVPAGNNRYKVEGACVSIEFLVLGMIENNTYLISDDKATIVVDPSSRAPQIYEALEGKKLDAIMLTHCHWDHVGAACDLKELTGAPVVSSSIDAGVIELPDERSGRRTTTACSVDTRLDDGSIFEVGNMKWRSILTPGHTKGGMCWFLDSNDGSNPTGSPVLISGDILFNGTHGRTDFIDGDSNEMRASLNKLAKLPNETLVLPGHNDLTTIGAERQRTLHA